MNLCDFISSFFYTGKVKYAPGTFTSFITLLIIGALITLRVPPVYFIYLTFFFIIIGIICSHISEKRSGKIDPGWITIDETTGMFFAVIIVNFYILSLVQIIVFLLLAFAFFRFFDIYKPFPIRQLQKLPGGIGIMIDDIVAGIFANLVARVFFYLIFKIKI